MRIGPKRFDGRLELIVGIALLLTTQPTIRSAVVRLLLIVHEWHRRVLSERACGFFALG